MRSLMSEFSDCIIIRYLVRSGNRVAHKLAKKVAKKATRYPPISDNFISEIAQDKDPPLAVAFILCVLDSADL